MLKECLQNTTAHGLPQLVDRHNSCPSKIVWTFIFLVSTGIFCLHSGSLIQKYLQYDTSVAVNLKDIDFILPDIYICNNNRFSRLLADILALTNSSQFDELLKLEYGSAELKFMEDMRTVLHHSRKSLFNLLSNRNFIDAVENVRTRGDYMKLFEQVFEIVPNALHAYCYKMKDEIKNSLFDFDGIEFSLYTDIGGLSTQTNTSKLFEKLTKLSDDASHTVYVVPKGEYPHLKSAHKKIEAGRKTIITITMDYYERVSRKRYHCMDPVEKVEQIHPYDTNRSIIYNDTPLDCAYSALHKHLRTKCDCIYGIQPYSIDDWNIGVPCKIDDYYMDYFCFDVRSQNPEVYLADCRHRTPCKLPVYHIESDKYALTDEKKKSMVYNLWARLRDKRLLRHFSANTSFDLIQNFVTIVLQIPTLRARRWKETFAYDLKDLLSDIGGILGFYIGVSVVTCLEILGYGSRWLSEWLADKQKRQSKSIDKDAAIELI